MRVQVETAAGALLGQQLEGYQVFRGIPYAAPPVGDRRFAAPEPVEPWSGVREALAFGGSAPQPVSPGVLPVGRQDEDCLFLNVYTPGVGAAKRPVMCFIHGGAFFLGSAAEATYDGGPLAQRGDVVVVTLNYRLGALGFLSFAALGGAEWGAATNAGLLDQVAALTWVRDNIAMFGGDPAQVTVFGESAGAASVVSLLGLPAARGLFARAIAQSGHGKLLGSAALAAQTAERWLQATGVGRVEPKALRSLPVDQVLAAQTAVQGADFRLFAPNVDGEMLPYEPLEAIRRGDARGVPLLLGTNRDEITLFTAPNRPAIDEATLLRRIQRSVPRASLSWTAETVSVYQRSRLAHGLPHSPLDLLDALETALRFRMPVLELAEAQASQHTPTFMYEFEWRSPARQGTLGATHALELPFVFGTVGKALLRLTGDGPELRALSHRMMDAWLAFARHGQPGADAEGLWPAYDVKQRSTMVFDLHTRVERAPFEEERACWARLA